MMIMKSSLTTKQHYTCQNIVKKFAVFSSTFVLALSYMTASAKSLHHHHHHRGHQVTINLASNRIDGLGDYTANKIDESVDQLPSKNLHRLSKHRHSNTVIATSSRTGKKVQQGIASWYGPGFNRHRTALGDRYNMFAMTAASRTLPLKSYARVTNLRNGKQIVVKINDRGPYVAPRILDLSYAAAKKLNIIKTGTALVRIELIAPSTVEV